MNFRFLPVLLLLSLGIFANTFGQNGRCGEVYVDVKKGRINKLKPSVTMEKIQDALPCYTGVTQEDEGYNCGGGVFFIKHDFYAYTGRDYWEIRSGFKGTWSHKLLGLKPADFEFRYGEPVRQEIIPGYTVQFFKMKYGCIRIQFGDESGRAEEVGIHHTQASKVELCY